MLRDVADDGLAAIPDRYVLHGDGRLLDRGPTLGSPVQLGMESVSRSWANIGGSGIATPTIPIPLQLIGRDLENQRHSTVRAWADVARNDKHWRTRANVAPITSDDQVLRREPWPRERADFA